MNLESGVLQIHIEDIIPNRFQPRLTFDEQGLKELADSIKEHGIIQPLVLRKLGDKYEIIAGERRYKAAQIAGLTTVPAVIANIDDNRSAEVALVENVQRRDLTAIEEARSYKSLLDKGYLTQEQLAKRMGLSQPSIANKLRLLNLDEEVQQALLEEKISERHARTLLTLEDKAAQREWLHRIINERMTVRQLDLELKKAKNGNFISPMEDKSESEDVPLVESTPSLDEIKANSVDIKEANKGNLHSIEEPPEEVDSNFQKATTIPDFNVTTPDTTDNNTSSSSSNGLFFNIPSSAEENKPQMTELDNQNKMEVFDDPTIERNQFIDESIPTPPSEFKVEEQKEEKFEPVTPFEHKEEYPSYNFNSSNKFFTPIKEQQEVTIESPQDKEFDPMSTIDKITNPNSDSNSNGKMELKDAIAKIRECIESLGDNGFYIEVEEIDFENKYQIVMNIDKGN